MRLLSSKKGDLGLSLQQIIGLVLAFAVILMTLGLFFGLMNIFTAKADPGSIKTFNGIYDAVGALYDERNTHEACIIKSEFLKADWAVVGFNSDCVRTADNDFYCEHGKDCAEEQCRSLSSPADSNIEKPSWCGTGPCICLCNGGVVGDVSGNDCAEDTKNCRKFPPDSKFSAFYFINPTEGKCNDPDFNNNNNPGILGINRPGSYCDLVINSENCDFVGTDRGVVYGLVISKTTSLSPVKEGCTMSSGHAAIVFDLVYKESDLSAYKKDMISCSELVRELMTPKQEPQKEPEKKPEEPAKPQGEDITTTLQNTGKSTPSVNPK
jgi:hypothetical protein